MDQTSMYLIKLNNKIEKVKKKILVYQLTSNVLSDLPCFCYKEGLEIGGNCRVCLVEVKNSLKLQVSCAINIQDGMEVWTRTKRLSKSRESILELLLINHPLDCPICDQGGECDLQDQAMLFGNDWGRFYEKKRSVVDKNCGVFVKTVMTRCIHCTRCVRFTE